MKWQNVQKNAKYSILEPFLPKFGKKLIFHKIGLRHFLVSILYQTNSEKNSYLMDEQTNELLWWNQ